MKDGFIKVAACTPKIKVADVDYNVREIIKLMSDAEDNGAKVIVCYYLFPTFLPSATRTV